MHVMQLAATQITQSKCMQSCKSILTLYLIKKYHSCSHNYTKQPASSHFTLPTEFCSCYSHFSPPKQLIPFLSIFIIPPEKLWSLFPFPLNPKLPTKVIPQESCVRVFVALIASWGKHPEPLACKCWMFE